MKYQKSLIEVIKKNNLCIRDNPFGIQRLWPYSYIELFFEEFCNDLYQRNKSPNILEINQSNNLNLKLWELYFEKPIIENINVKQIIQKDFKDFLKFDFIISDEKFLLNNQILIRNLTNLINSNGILVIENVGLKSRKIINIYIKFFKSYVVEIFDFRTRSFISNNCILVIKKNNKNNLILRKFITLFLLLKFLIIEYLILFFKIILKK